MIGRLAYSALFSAVLPALPANWRGMSPVPASTLLTAGTVGHLRRQLVDGTLLLFVAQVNGILQPAVDSTQVVRVRTDKRAAWTRRADTPTAASVGMHGPGRGPMLGLPAHRSPQQAK